jgi:hypothetical protein
MRKTLYFAVISLFFQIYLSEFVMAQHVLPINDNDWAESNEHIYLTDEVTYVYITMDEADLDGFLADPYTDIYKPCSVRIVNSVIDETTTNVGIRPRGNSQRGSVKFPWKISFNEFVSGRKFYGVEKMNFAGEATDPSMSRESLAYEMMRSIGVAAGRTSHVWLEINDGTKVRGVYNNIEQVDEEFVQAWFGNKDGDLYKCRWKDQGARLSWVAPGDAATYASMDDYEEKISGSYQRLADFIDFIKFSDNVTFRNDIASWINVDSFLRAQAVDMYLGQWDGIWIFPNNYYLYWDTDSEKFEYVPWDLDHCMGMDYWFLPYFFGTNWATRGFYNWGLNSEAAEASGDNGPPIIDRLLEIPLYESKLAGYVQELASYHGHPSKLSNSIDMHFNLLDPLAFTGTFSGSSMDNGYDAGDFDSSWSSPSSYSAFSNPATWGIVPFLETRSAYVRDNYPSLSPQASSPLVINEILGKNSNGITDEFGENEDWVEIYNKSSQAIDLGGYFLSDKYSDTKKWEIPAGTIVQPNDYIIFWCDEDISQGPLHADFKIDTDGGGVYLFSPTTSLNFLVSSLRYPPLNEDQSWARVPSGGQNSIALNSPTPYAFNEPNSFYLCKEGFVPDPIRVYATGATPNEFVAFLWSYNAGNAIVSGAQCTGITLGLATPFFLGAYLSTDSFGVAFSQLPKNRVPADIYVQAVDVNTCAVSNVLQF